MEIPKLTDEQKEYRLERIRPVVSFEDDLYYIKPVDPDRVAFSWSPERIGKAENLVSFRTIKTFHTYAYGGFFKPSINEVLAQIPKDVVETVVAFETLDAEIVGEFHAATTILYREASKGTRFDLIAKFDL